MSVENRNGREKYECRLRHYYNDDYINNKCVVVCFLQIMMYVCLFVSSFFFSCIYNLLACFRYLFFFTSPALHLYVSPFFILNPMSSEHYFFSLFLHSLFSLLAKMVIRLHNKWKMEKRGRKRKIERLNQC